MSISQTIDTQSSKRERVLEGARNAFLAYGYSRTTMDDIARAAEVSRPALYLLFKNKTDIYRALGETLLAQSLEAGRTVLSGDEPFAERVMEAFDRALFRMMAPFRASPHGHELLDMKNSLAADIIADWRQDFAGALATAINREARRNGVDLASRHLSPRGLADILLDGLEGMKERGVCGDDKMEATRELITVVALSLRS